MIKTIAILSVMIAANALMILSISRAAKRVDYSLRKFFVQRLSMDDFDANLPEKKIIEEIKLETEPDEYSFFKRKPAVQTLISTDENVGRAHYKSDTMKSDYKAIKQISNYTPEYALECAKKQILKDENPEVFKDYKGVLDLMDYDTVFSLNSLDPEKQEEILRNNLNPEQQSIIEDFLTESGKRFDSIDFYGYLSQMAEIYNSGFCVKTGNPCEDDKQLDDETSLVFDNQICEGSQVIYKNRMYDYSI